MRSIAVVLVAATGCVGGADDDPGVDIDAGADVDPEPGCVSFGFCDVSPFGEPVHYADVWGAADDAIWVVGSGGAVRFFDGERWTERDTGAAGDLSAIDGSAADDVWAVGDGGAIWRRDGAAWTRLDAGVAVDLNDVAVVSPTEVYVVGTDYTLLRYDGAAWADMGATFTGASVNAVDALGADRVVASDGFDILEWDGASWTTTATTPGGPTVHDLQVLDATTTLVLRSNLGGHLVERLEGGQLDYVAGDSEPSSALFARAADDGVVAGQRGALAIFDAAGRREIEHGNHTMRGVWADSTGAIWAAGEFGTILRLEPGASDSRVIDAGDQHTMLAVHARAAGDVWMAGLGGKIVHHDGASWTAVDSGTDADLHGIAEVGETVWVAGDHGVVVELAPGGPIRRDIDRDASLRSIVADGDAGVWVAGGVLERWDGETWSPVVSSLGRFATDASSPGPGEIWLAQADGWVSRFVDGAQQPVGSPTSNDLWSIWIGTPDNVVVGAYANDIHGYDGQTWSEEIHDDSTTPGAIFDLWGTEGDLFAVGSQLLHDGGGGWVDTEMTGRFLRSMSGAGGVVWAVGWEQRFVYLER
jgi:hypothetical protein